MFDRFLKKSKTNGIVIMVVLTLIAAVILFLGRNVLSVGLFHRAALNAKPIDFYDLTKEDIKDGTKVSGTICYVFDAYSYATKEEYGTKKTVSKDYIVPVGEEEYMSITLGGSKMKFADKNMDLTYDLMCGEDVNPDDFVEIEINGVIHPLGQDELKHFKQYVSELEGWTDEEKELFLPFTILDSTGKEASQSKGKTALAVIILIAVAILILIGVLCLRSGLKGKCLKAVNDYCKAFPDPEGEKRKLEAFYQAEPAVHGYRINEEVLMYISGNSPMVFACKDILWIYLEVTQHRTNGIPTGKTRAVVICTKNGGSNTIPSGSEQASDEIMKYIARQMPYIIVGFSDEIRDGYNKDRAGMAAYVEGRRQEFLRANLGYGFAEAGSDAAAVSAPSINPDAIVSVELTSVPFDKKEEVADVLSELTGKSLDDALSTVDLVPIFVFNNITGSEAEAYKNKLEAVGAKVSIR